MKDKPKIINAKKGETLYSGDTVGVKLGKDTQFKEGVNKRGFTPLKKRGDN